MNNCNFDKLFKLSEDISILKDDNSKQPTIFNLIKAIVRGKLHETSHSKVLAELLRNDRRILVSFLKDFVDLSIDEKDELDIYIEKDNIDITIETDNFVVIIENKVNNAPERKEQIDKYVTLKYDENSNRDIHVLYLTRDYPAPPSEYSWTETKDKCQISLKTYRKDVRKWIKKIYESGDRYYSLHSAIYHYKNYLDYIFDNNRMEVSGDIKKVIDCQISQDDNIDDPEKKITAVENLADKFKIVYDECKKYQYELTWQHIKDQIKNRLKDYKLFDLEEYKWDLPDAGIPFKFTDFPELEFYAIVSYLQRRYIGIIQYNHSSEPNTEIANKLKNLLPDSIYGGERISKSFVNSTRRYPYWINVDSDQNLVDFFTKMINTLQKNGNVKFLDKPYE